MSPPHKELAIWDISPCKKAAISSTKMKASRFLFPVTDSICSIIQIFASANRNFPFDSNVFPRLNSLYPFINGVICFFLVIYLSSL